MKNNILLLIAISLFSSCFNYDDEQPQINEQVLEPFYMRGPLSDRNLDIDLNLYQLSFFNNDNGFGNRRFMHTQYQFKDNDNKVVQELNDVTDERYLSEVEIRFVEAQDFQPEDWLDKPFFTRTDSSTAEPTGLGSIILHTQDGVLAMTSDFHSDATSKTRITEISGGSYLNDPLLKVVTININDEFRLYEDELTPWDGRTIMLKDIEVKALIRIREL